MTNESHSPRVLRITFECHVPKGLRRNVRGKRVEAAIERLTTAVQALAPSVFPWADRIVVNYDWSYRWWDGKETIELPSSEDNTVT